MLTVANVGDSSCVLCRSDGSAARILRMHRLNDSLERERVLSKDAKIFNNRLNGVLAVSRAFGDTPFKEFNTAGTLDINRNPLIATPDIHFESIDIDTEFAILGTDGLFDIMEPQIVANYVRRRLGESKSLQQTAVDLTKEAISRGSIDNVSAIIMLFHSGR